MAMIDLKIDQKQRKSNAAYCKQHGITLPTIKQLQNPSTIPTNIKQELEGIGLWDIHPKNLFRITWKNDPRTTGGGHGKVNYLKLPPALTGCKANIIALTGRWFPTGAHKVGATFGCLVPKLITGQFNPDNDWAVWPSTGNFCRGGAYISSLLSCNSIAILPEQMSKERFEWLGKVAGEIITTKGGESNVKEIFDKCWELRADGRSIKIFNQFEELGNPLWHYHVTGQALKEALESEMKPGDRLAGAVYSSGSGGTMGSGYYLKEHFPGAKMAVVEALQCPTLLNNGYGDHRIEGIGDKHVPWIHDMKNTDMVIAVDDEDTIRLLRLFNEPEGRAELAAMGVEQELIDKLDLLGISGICNLVAAIKFAKYYELTEKDYVTTIFTDSMDLYGSRLTELTQERGAYQQRTADRDLELLSGISIDNMQELGHYDKKRVHNLKYFTWIEQQQRELSELNAQWYDHENYWRPTLNQADEIDHLISEFNQLG